MPSSTRLLPRFSFPLTLAALTAFLTVGCSVSFDAAFDATAQFGGTGGGGGITNLSGSATTGGGEEGGIPLPPETTPDGHASYLTLCGGGCFDSMSSFACSQDTNADGSLKVACQVVPSANGASSVCLPAGNTELGGPCTKSADCKANMGCARGEAGGGVCAPYCCEDIESCAIGTYCAPRVMNDDYLSLSPVHIPVCIEATPCTLLDDTSCPVGKTCTLVRADGTTSCVTPGLGIVGESCPCAAGHVCAISLNKCLALCEIGKSGCPDGMICQTGAKSLPENVGICVN